MPGFPDVGTHYGNLSVVEDVTDMIFQITPEDKPFMTMIGETSNVQQPFHQWQTRELTTRQHNAVPEGFTYDFTLGTNTPVRQANMCQIISKEIRVSNTEQATNHYAIANMFADQMELRLAEVGTDFEHALLRSSMFSGGTATARQMNGAINVAISAGTLYTNYGGATNTLTEDDFNDHVNDMWDIGSEGRDVLCNGKMKRRISTFTSSNTQFIQADQQRIVNTLSVYETDFFPTQIHLSRDVPKEGDAVMSASSTYSGHALLFVDRTMFKAAYLRRFTSKRVPETADSADGVIVGEATLEAGHPLGHLYVDKIVIE